MNINKICFVGQIAYKPEARSTTTGKLVCTLKVCQREKAKKADKQYYERWLEVDLWDQSAEKVARLNVGAWVEITGKLHCGERDLYDPAAKARVRVRGAISVQLPNVRVIVDADEIAEAQEVLIPIEPREGRQRSAAAPQRATEPTYAAPNYDDPDADIPF